MLGWPQEFQFFNMTKRRTAGLLPYYRNNSNTYVYLQRRTTDAPTSPGKLSLFGGGLEGDETPEEALVREIAEELQYNLTTWDFLTLQETSSQILSAFTVEVTEDFDNNVTVCEGERGEFLSLSMYNERSDLTDDLRIVLEIFSKQEKEWIRTPVSDTF